MKTKEKPIYERAYEVSQWLQGTANVLFTKGIASNKKPELDYKHPFVFAAKIPGAIGGFFCGAVTGATLITMAGSSLGFPTNPINVAAGVAGLGGGYYFGKMGFEVGRDLSQAVLSLSRLLSGLALEKSATLINDWAKNADPQTAYEDKNGHFVIPPNSPYLAQNRTRSMKNVTPGQEGQDYPGDMPPGFEDLDFADVHVYRM